MRPQACDSVCFNGPVPFVQRALVTLGGDLSTRHLAAPVGEPAPGDTWQGETSCGLTGALTFVGPARAGLLLGKAGACPDCLARESARQRGEDPGG